jgi:hypothetical protein
MKHAEIAALKSKATLGETPEFGGTWANQLGATMTLTVNGDMISGTYRSKVSGGGGPTPPKPLTGFKNGDLIAFRRELGSALQLAHRLGGAAHRK